MYIVVQAIVNHQLQISSERTIPLGAVKYVGTSTLKDDWLSLGVGSPQEPDPLINCVFKTEFFTQLKNTMSGGVNLKIAESYVDSSSQKDFPNNPSGSSTTRSLANQVWLRWLRIPAYPGMTCTRAARSTQGRVSHQAPDLGQHRKESKWLASQ